MRIIKIKNNQGTADVYAGQQIQPGAYYTIQNEDEAKKFAYDIKVNNHHSADPQKLIVADSDNDLSYEDGKRWLEGTIATEVEIKEEYVKTGGHYQAQIFEFDITASAGIQTMDISFPFPISILAAEWHGKADIAGDDITVQVAPDTIVGNITSDVAINDIVINVSQTVIDNTAIGFRINLWDGTNTSDLGRVLNVDTANLQITVETAADTAFLATTPTYVRQTVEMIPNAKLTSTGRHQVGASKIGGSHLPANKAIKIKYNNVDGLAKKFYFLLDWLY